VDIEQGPPKHTCVQGMTAPGQTCAGCEWRETSHLEPAERVPSWVPPVAWLWILGGLSLIVALALAASTT